MVVLLLLLLLVVVAAVRVDDRVRAVRRSDLRVCILLVVVALV